MERDRNVIDMSKLNAQLKNVDRELQKLRAHRGYISELMVQGIGPIPDTESMDRVSRETVGTAGRLTLTWREAGQVQYHA